MKKPSLRWGSRTSFAVGTNLGTCATGGAGALRRRRRGRAKAQGVLHGSNCESALLSEWRSLGAGLGRPSEKRDRLRKVKAGQIQQPADGGAGRLVINLGVLGARHYRRRERKRVLGAPGRRLRRRTRPTKLARCSDQSR